MDRALGLIAAITIAACSNKPSASDVPEDSGVEGDVLQDSSTRPDDAQRQESGDDSSVLQDAQDAEGPPCVPDGGFYTCLGGTWPTCPIAVWDVPSPLAGCDFSLASCLRCDGIVRGMNVPPMIGTGATCNCRDAGYPIPDGSTGYWDCVGTGSTCQ